MHHLCITSFSFFSDTGFTRLLIAQAYIWKPFDVLENSDKLFPFHTTFSLKRVG